MTDANVVLGIIGDSTALGGDLQVDRERAVAAIAPIAEHLGLSVEAAARGILTVTVSNLVRAIRAITVKRGLDHRHFALMAFGGAGPLHASALMREMSIGEVIVPEHPGLLCALGLLAADMQFDLSRTRVVRLSAATDTARSTFADLLQEAEAILEREGVEEGARDFALSIDMRYVGQSWELSIPIESLDAFDPESLHREFDRVHEERFGYAVENEEIDCVTFRLVATGRTPRLPRRVEGVSSQSPPQPTSMRRLHLVEPPVDAPVYDRRSLVPGHEIAGPAVIEQLDATTVLLPGQHAHVDRWANLRIADATIPAEGDR